jgi:hypothetical protein
VEIKVCVPVCLVRVERAGMKRDSTEKEKKGILKFTGAVFLY